MIEPIEMSCVREVTVRYKTVRKYSHPRRLTNSRELFATFRARFAAERCEVFAALILNCKNEIMALDVVSRGSLNTSIVHPREVFTVPVRLQAGALILMHNHPSGDPAPSREDRECTERLVKASSILGIRILDHIVFGFDDYYSFADAGILNAVTKEGEKFDAS